MLVGASLASAKVGYKPLKEFAGAWPAGPIAMGLDRSAAMRQNGFSVEAVIALSAFAAHNAQERIPCGLAVGTD